MKLWHHFSEKQNTKQNKPYASDKNVIDKQFKSMLYYMSLLFIILLATTGLETLSVLSLSQMWRLDMSDLIKFYSCLECHGIAVQFYVLSSM